MTDDHEFDIEELRMWQQVQKLYQDALARHPDPRDPDYPGLEGEDD